MAIKSRIDVSYFSSLTGAEAVSDFNVRLEKVRSHQAPVTAEDVAVVFSGAERSVYVEQCLTRLSLSVPQDVGWGGGCT